MNFVVFSMNNNWLVNMRKKITSIPGARHICNPIRNVNDISKLPLSIYIVDADTIRNKELLQRVKESDNVLKVYLASFKPNEIALDFPRYDILPSEVPQETIIKIADETNVIYESSKEEEPEPVIEKHEAVEAVSQTVKLIEPPPVRVEEDIDDDFDNLDKMPRRSHRPVISMREAIYEDEDSYSAFDGREDLKKLAAQIPGVRMTQNEAKAINKEQPVERTPSLISERLKEPTKIVPPKVPPVKAPSIAEEIKQEKRALHEIIHSNNERPDANIGQRQFVEALGIEVDMRAPIINGRPYEYVMLDNDKVSVDRALSEYRVTKLQRSGLDAFGIVKEIKKIKQDENEIRTQTMRERELKRQKFLQQFDTAEVAVPEIKNKEPEKRKDIFKDLGGEHLPSTGPKVVDETAFTPKKPSVPKPMPAPPVEDDFEFKQREEILQSQEEAKKRRLIMETESESVSDLFNRRREEQRRLTEEALESSSSQKKNLLPDLPSKKLTDRSELSKFYEEKNIKRAQSKTGLKTNVRPPQEMIEKVVEDEEDGDDDGDNKKKKGFWGKFKK